MKISIAIILMTFFGTSTYAQIGKTYTEVQELYGKENFPGLELRNEGGLLVEDKQITENEVRMIMYNSDSIVVGVAIGYADSSITESELKQLTSEELPEFAGEKSAKMGSTTYKLDTINNYLILLNSVSTENLFPLTGVLFMMDPKVIEGWTGKITI